MDISKFSGAAAHPFIIVRLRFFGVDIFIFSYPFFQGQTIQNTGHITIENEEEKRDLTTLPGPSNESTSISPSISLQGSEDVISETDQSSSKLATTEASITTNLLTTPLEITQETGQMYLKYSLIYKFKPFDIFRNYWKKFLSQANPQLVATKYAVSQS